MKIRRLLFLLLMNLPLFLVAADYEDLFEERIRTVVAVEFFVETEVDRRPSAEVGIVADENGLIVMQDHALPGWVPPEQLKEFKVYPVRTRDEFSAEYLGQDSLTGWHFLRVEDPGFREHVIPVTAYETEVPRLGQDLWGISVMDKEFDFEPYFLISRFSLMRDLPQDLGFTVAEVSSPGSLVFAANGNLVGWSTTSYLREAYLHVGEERLQVGIEGARESGSFLPTHEVLPYLDRVPADPAQRDVPWIGVASLQPVEREVADFLGTADRGAVILSEVVKGSSADRSDLQKGDVVVAIDGEPIPYFRPHHASPQHFQREILKRQPGDSMRFSVIRGTESLEREVEVEVRPSTVREARREYFAKIGMTVREFLLFDGLARRVEPEPEQGLVVQFVRPNSPADSGGLSVGDWIQEVDGVTISKYSEAVELITAAEQAADRREIVFLISRQNENSVVRVRLR